MNFCVSAMLYSKEGVVVSREDTIFKVDIDKKIGFGVEGISTFVANPTVNEDLDVDYDGTAVAYECDPATMQQVTTPSPHGPYDILKICVNETTSDTLEISSVYAFKLSVVDGFVVFNAIVEGVVPKDLEDLALQKCENGICVVQVHLINDFFTEGVNTELKVEGSVLLKPKSNLRKQGGQDAVKGGFSMLVALDDDKPCRDDVGKSIASVISKFKLP